jgi:hypothetical protein
MDHITITELRKDFKNKRGESFTEEEFDIILDGFKKYAEKRGLYTSRAIRKARERGWMSVQMVHFFKQYATE